ncbi:carboxypeptidase-like regulatory domain-containing protein [Flavobacterium procerum]|uniref:Carboxypeptidase-like regulatory domain-containing protein n=1 Tax=Flavobacterium procerum TaxID=1455569 RepID=A0ABV6BPM2_9FLAO
MKKLLLFLFTSAIGFSQSIYKGNVSEKGAPIPGATICVLNTKNCTTSDFEGNYAIEVKKGDQLQISFVGMKTQVIKISNQTFQEDELIVNEIVSNDYIKKLEKTADSVKISKPTGYFNFNLGAYLGYDEISKINRKSDGLYELKYKYDYDRLSFEINQEYLISAPIRLPKYQSSYAQGRSINGDLAYQSPETNEIFSWGPNVNALQYSSNSSEYYPQGNIENRTSFGSAPLQLYNPNRFFRNSEDSKIAFTGQIESRKGNFLKLNFSYKTGNITIPNTRNNESTTSLKYFRTVSQYSKIETLLTYNNFENNFSNSNFGINKVVFANAITPVHFDTKSASVLSNGTQRSYSGFENNPYYLTEFNLDRNKSQTFSFNFNHKFNKNRISNTVNTNFQSSDVKNENGQSFYTAGISEPNFNQRVEKFKSFSVSDVFKHDFGYSKYVESKLDLRYQNRDLERNFFNRYNSLNDFPKNALMQTTFDISQNRFEALFNVNGSILIEDVPFYYNEMILKASTDLNYSSTVKNGLMPGYFVSVELRKLFDEDFTLTITNRYTQTEPSLQNNNLNFNSLHYSLDQFKQLQNNLELITPKNAVTINENSTNFDLNYRISGSWNLYLNYNFKKVDNLYVPLYDSNAVSWSPNVDYKQRGVEFSIENLGYYHRNFRYSFNLNFTYYKNEVTAILNNQSRIPFAGFADINKNYIVGQPLGVIVGSSYLRDANQNIIIDADGFPIKNLEPKILGNPNPDFVVGFSNTFQYKQFSLYLGFDWSQGGKLWNGTQQTLSYYGKSELTGEQRNITNYIFDGVTQSGAVNTKAVSFYDANQSVGQNRWTRYGIEGISEDAIEDATYFRLNSLKLSYKHNHNYTSNKTEFTISFFMNNVFVAAKSKSAFALNSMFNSLDTSGLDYFNAPMMRSFGSSLTIKF